MPRGSNPSPKLALKALTLDAASPVHAFDWSLPTQNADGSWTPGKWASVKGAVEYRKNGLHLAGCDQIAWWQNHLRAHKNLVCWVVEYDGNTSIGCHGFAARRARILRPWNGEEV